MRVVILGAGGLVGSATAFVLALRSTVEELVLVDTREELASAHAMDLEQLTATVRPFHVTTGTPEALAEADVAVLAVSAPALGAVRAGANLEPNARTLAALLPALRRLPAHALLWVATNPVDPLCTWLHERLQLDRGRLLGYTLNDTARLRVAIGRCLDVAPSRVEAWALGEHAGVQVPLLSRVRVDGEPVVLDGEQRRWVSAEVEAWFQRWQALETGRSSQWSTGEGLPRLIQAALDHDPGPWPAAVVLTGEYGLHGVSLTVPVSFGAQGAQPQVWDLAPEEQAALKRAAESVTAATGLLREAP